MAFSTYPELFRISAVRRILLLGLLVRIPLFGAFVLLTLHIVQHLDQSYGMAGVLDMFAALAIAISGPWRGRLLDRIGLRRTLGPALLLYAACWAVAPWSGYWVLLVLVSVAGLFTPPIFTIVRQVLLAAVTRQQRTAVLSLDSVFTEFSFMLGPLMGVFIATQMPTPIALAIFQGMAVLAGVVIWLDNPSMVSAADEDDAAEEHQSSGRWITPWVVVVLATSVTATIVLTSADLGTVAALRHMDATASIGWVLALWGASSAIGGIVYGAMKQGPPSYILMGLLAATTIPIAFAEGRFSFAILLFLSGFFCAPTITATVADLTRSVPPSRRGEAMGWHGSSFTLGSAIGAPTAGFAIDHLGWEGAFEIGGGIGVVVAVLGLIARQLTHHRDAGSAAHAEGSEDLPGGLAAVERVEVQTGRAAGE